MKNDVRRVYLILGVTLFAFLALSWISHGFTPRLPRPPQLEARRVR